MNSIDFLFFFQNIFEQKSHFLDSAEKPPRIRIRGWHGIKNDAWCRTGKGGSNRWLLLRLLFQAA